MKKGHNQRIKIDDSALIIYFDGSNPPCGSLASVKIHYEI